MGDTAVLTLLLKGEVKSDHPDWEFCSQFAWRDDEESEMVGDGDGGDGQVDGNAAGDDSGSATFDPLPEASWQPGKGVALTNPLGCLSDSYAGTGLQFTNYVQGF